MKKFILKVLFFSLPVILLVIALEVILQAIPNEYSVKNDYLDSNSNDVETLVLGSSHAFFGINPEYLPGNSFNAANVSQTIDYDLKILKKYDSNLRKIKTVIIPISYFSLFSALDHGAEKWRKKNYVIYYDLDIADQFKEHSEFLSNKLKLNITRSRLILMNYTPPVSKGGWGMSYESGNSQDLNKTADIALKRHTVDNYDLLQNNIAALKEIIEICNKHNAKVVFFTPPAYKTYSQNLKKDQYDLTIKSIEGVVGDCKNCSYLNLINDASYVKEDFYDADHLNEVGAKKLSLFFKDYLEQ